MSFRLDHAGTNSRGRIRTCISRVRGEVTVVFTTGQSLLDLFQQLAGEPTRKADSGHDFSRYLMLRDYAPVPGTLIPGRAAALRVDSFGAKYLSKTDLIDANAAAGFTYAAILIPVLKQCGADLSRENIMRQAANLKGIELPLFLPGVKVNTSPTNYSPIRQMQLATFNGESWELFGEILDA